MASEDYPKAELDIPGSEALEKGFRAIIEECVENTITSRALRHEAQGISDDQTRRKLRQADDYDGQVATVAGLFDKFLPSPVGQTWLEAIGERADIVEDERLQDVEG